jgi:hypothetical protein
VRLPMQCVAFTARRPGECGPGHEPALCRGYESALTLVLLRIGCSNSRRKADLATLSSGELPSSKARIGRSGCMSGRGFRTRTGCCE